MEASSPASLSGFNPRTRTGCDKPRELLGITDLEFQSTHPHGVRHRARYLPLSRFHVSIHAPARGATDAVSIEVTCYASFNPRTRTGCDLGSPKVGIL